MANENIPTKSTTISVTMIHTSFSQHLLMLPLLNYNTNIVIITSNIVRYPVAMPVTISAPIPETPRDQANSGTLVPRP